MKYHRTDDISSKMLLAYLDGEVTKSESSAIEDYLRETPAARRQLDKLRGMMDSLAEPNNAVENMDLTASVRRAIQTPAPSPRRPFFLRPLLAAGVACVAAAIIIPIWISSSRPNDDGGFRIKSAAPLERFPQDRWVGIKAYRLGKAGKVHRISKTIRFDDELLFSYNNAKQGSFTHLMIFAVNKAGNVFWFYPAYEHVDTNPAAIEVKSGATDQELPTKIQHNLSPGPLYIYGLFLHEPMTVRRIEALVAKLHRSATSVGEPMRRLPINDSAQHVMNVSVER